MLIQADKTTLLDVARASVDHGLRDEAPVPLEPGNYPADLQRSGACFVTLKIQGKLRGCIGSLQPRRPLVADCADNAFAAAFRDPRFPAVSRKESS